jgi:murein DD-endopeptidase MepM/ murein hydrolase activator NlpD
VSDPTQPNLSGTQPPQAPVDAVAQLLQRGAANIAALQGADLNQKIPPVQYDPVTRQRYFDVVPVPSRRMMSSPLAKTGVYAQGKSKERLVQSGWGDQQQNNTRNFGLDYPVSKGESVFAAADGTVTFVGFATKGTIAQTQQVNKITSNASAQTLLDANGAVVASVAMNNIGFDGISVVIAHSGDFAGYLTLYTHLAGTPLSEGDKVTEGQTIGTAGTTGGPLGFWTGQPFLHFQIDLTAYGQVAPTNPATLVPNYWPNHLDSSAALNTVPGVVVLGIASTGLQVASASGLASTQALNRAVQLENQTLSDLKENQSSYADLLASRLQMDQTALYAAVGAFQHGAVIVTNPMTFDFVKGVWSDNGQPL